MPVHEDRAAKRVLTGADGRGLASRGVAPINAAAFMGVEVLMLPQPGKEVQGVPGLSQNGRALLLCRQGQAGLAAGTSHPHGREPAGTATLSPAAPS